MQYPEERTRLDNIERWLLKKVYFLWVVLVVFLTVAGFVRRWLCEKCVCRFFGHNLVDNGSYAGPDSGAEYLICKRCGYTWHHIYY